MYGLINTLRNVGRHPNISFSMRTCLSSVAPRLSVPATLKATAASSSARWQPGLFRGKIRAANMLSNQRRFSTAVEGKENVFAGDKNKLAIRNYLQDVVVRAADIKKTDFVKVAVTVESKQQIEIITNMLDKLITQINHFYSDPRSVQAQIAHHVDFLCFTLSHLEAIDYHLKKLLGKSVFLSNSDAILSSLIENGNAILDKFKEHATKPVPPRKKATVLSGADNYQLEIKRFEEQQRYSGNPEFAILMNKIWTYGIENRHRTKKIFISYAWPEKDGDQKEEWSQQLVIQLAKDLTRMGYQVFLDKNHSGAGFLLASFMEKIQRVDHVLVISTRTMGDKLTKPNSGVCFEHNQITDCLVRYPDLINRRFVIPVLLNNSKYCHQEFSDIAEVSICKEGYLNALESLVTHLYDAGEIEFRAWWKLTVENVLHQRVVFNPPPVDPYAVQRHELSDEVFIKLKTLSHAARTNTTLACVGLPGTGKTHLLRQFFHDQKRKYYIAAWFNAENADTLVTSYRQFASQEHLNLLKGKELSDFKDEEIIKLVRDKLAQTPESLLVYDNAESLPLIEQMMPAYGHHHILISSRQRIWPHMVEVDRMSEEEGCQLIHNITNLPQDDAMRKLVIELDRIPLALSHAAAYMQIKQVSCRHYHDKYLADKAKLLTTQVKAPSLAHDHLSIWITWQNIFNLLTKANPETVRALQITCLVDAENIPDLLLEQVLAYQKRQKKLSRVQKIEPLYSLIPVLGCTFSLISAIENNSPITFVCGVAISIACFNYLANYSLAQRRGDGFMLDKFDSHNETRSALVEYSVIIPNPKVNNFSMHRLVQDILRTTLSGDELSPILIGVWTSLCMYYKMLKNDLSQADDKKTLWNLLLHFKAANNVTLAKEIYITLEWNVHSSLVGYADTTVFHTGYMPYHNDATNLDEFCAKYAKFLNCYKQLCRDLKQDELAASLTNEVFKEMPGNESVQTVHDKENNKEGQSNANIPKPPGP